MWQIQNLRGQHEEGRVGHKDICLLDDKWGSATKRRNTHSFDVAVGDTGAMDMR